MEVALICGSRNWSDRESKAPISAALKELKDQGVSIVVTGGARGVDKIAENIAFSQGFKVKSEPANWDAFGKAAGPIRNAAMLHLYAPDIVVAFPRGKSAGTWHMVTLARKAGILTVVIDDSLEGGKKIYPPQLTLRAGNGKS